MFGKKDHGRADELEHGKSSSEHVDSSHESEENGVHHTMNMKLFLALVAMSFLWVGSQIPLYIFGSVIPLIYSDIGGVDRYVWFVIAYLIPVAALCPFVGALSDLFGRQAVAITGQALLIIGPIITTTAHTMNIAIAGQVFSGLGAGLNEMIALAGTAEMVPVKKRGAYVGMVVLTILPFCASTLYAQLIAAESGWRYTGILVCLWNFIGLVLCIFCYRPPSRRSHENTAKSILAKVDYMGGLLSTGGVLCFMMGLQWGAEQYEWNSPHVLAPFIIGIVVFILFCIWEAKFAKYPMLPAEIFTREKRTMILILVITFLSGANFFVMLLFWPTEVYNVYGNDPLGIGVRTLPIGFGIVGGAAICLILIPVTGGRIRELMIFFTAMMTAGAGAMSVARTDNLPTVYAIVTIASLGVGGVIIPCSIIAQVVCPPHLIATITAITLSIRYVGGAIGYTAYYNIFYHYYEIYAQDIVAIQTIVYKGIVEASEANFYLIQALTVYVSNARWTDLRDLIQNDPRVMRKDVAEELIVEAAQQAFVLAYRWPYWMSIAFGAICFICSFFVGDVRRWVLDSQVAMEEVAADAATGPHRGAGMQGVGGEGKRG